MAAGSGIALVVWGVTAVALVAAIGLGIVWWRLGRGPGSVPGSLLYLHKSRVMDIYYIGGYGPALVREVQERATVTKHNKLQIGSVPNKFFDLVGGGSKEHQIVNTYVTHADPAEVLGMVLNALERRHGIVHADLIDMRIDANRAWRRRRSTRLSGIRGDVYVSVAGAFRLVGDTKDKVEYVAAMKGFRVRVECSTAGLHLEDGEEVPTGPFNGTCVGRVQPLDPETGELTILPVAILR